jgi:hypothetical protein
VRILWLAFLAVVLATTTDMARAWAAPGLRVAIVGSPQDAPLTRQLRVELAGLGFETIVHENWSDVDAAGDALQLMRAENVAAVIRTWPDKARVEVWVADPDAGTLSTRGMNPTRPDTTPRVLALRAIELLRASLRELETKRQAPPEPLPSPIVAAPLDQGPVVIPPAEPPRSARWVVGLGAGPALSPGGVGVGMIAQPKLQAWPHENWGISATGLVPLGAPRVSDPVGSATVGVFMAGVGPAFRLRPRRGLWFEAGIGAGGAILRTKGSTSTPFTAQADVATQATGYATMELSYAFAGDLALGGNVLVGSLLSPAEIRFAGRSVAKWGAPYAVATLGLSLRLY